MKSPLAAQFFDLLKTIILLLTGQFRSSAVPQFRSSAVPQFRSSAVPQFRSSAVPQFRSSAVPQFRRERGRIVSVS